MIPITLRNGTRIRVEGYPVQIPGWTELQLCCHHGDKYGEIAETRWVVSEVSTGKRLTINDYATDTEAIAAATAFLSAHTKERIRELVSRVAA